MPGSNCDLHLSQVENFIEAMQSMPSDMMVLNSRAMMDEEVAASAKETKSREVRRRVLLFQIVTSLRPTRVNTKLTAAVIDASQIAKVGPAPALCSMEAEKYMMVLIPANCCTA